MNSQTAAEKLQISTSTIRRWCRTGRIQAVKLAGRWVIEPSSLPTTGKETTMEHKSGDQVRIGDVVVTLGTARFGARISWRFHVESELHAVQEYKSYPTADEAIAAARVWLGVDADPSPVCRCGRPATMNASVAKTCEDCYDKYAD